MAKQRYQFNRTKALNEMARRFTTGAAKARAPVPDASKATVKFPPFIPKVGDLVVVTEVSVLDPEPHLKKGDRLVVVAKLSRPPEMRLIANVREVRFSSVLGTRFDDKLQPSDDGEWTLLMTSNDGDGAYCKVELVNRVTPEADAEEALERIGEACRELLK